MPVPPLPFQRVGDWQSMPMIDNANDVIEKKSLEYIAQAITSRDKTMGATLRKIRAFLKFVAGCDQLLVFSTSPTSIFSLHHFI